MDISMVELLGDLTTNGLGPQNANVSASARVYDSLRKRIISLDLPPETTLSRSELATEYEVSQTPIREAMQKLEQDGLVKIFPQSKTIVTKIDIPQLFEAHFLRVAVECEAVRRLAEAPDATLVGKLRSIIRLQKALGGEEADKVMFNELDETFHQAIFAGVGQLGLYGLVKSKGGHLARARRLDLPTEGKIRAILKSHTDIVDAIEGQDPLAAQDAMRGHLTGTVARIENLQRENPGYFRTA